MSAKPIISATMTRSRATSSQPSSTSSQGQFRQTNIWNRNSVDISRATTTLQMRTVAAGIGESAAEGGGLRGDVAAGSCARGADSSIQVPPAWTRERCLSQAATAWRSAASS
jgi:hypothetical protein